PAARRFPAPCGDASYGRCRVLPHPGVRARGAMSRPARLAAAQLGPSGTKDENAARMRALVDRAADAGAQVVAFPELSLTPYFCIKNERGYEQYFEPVDNRYLVSVLEHAGRRRIASIVPFAERDGIQLFNSCV